MFRLSGLDERAAVDSTDERRALKAMGEGRSNHSEASQAMKMKRYVGYVETNRVGGRYEEAE